MGGKKKGGKAAPKKNEKNEENLDALLNQLSQVTQKNDSLRQGDKKESKKERSDKLKQIKKQNEEKAQEEYQQRKQMAQLMEFLKKQMAQSDTLENPSTDKEVDEKTCDDLMASCVSMQGWRKSMEDTHILRLPEDDLAMYSVFDGHSGTDVAEYAKENLLRVLQEQDGWSDRDYNKALSSGFLVLDKEMREKSLTAGSTATVVVVDHKKNKIYCANAGDSRAVMCVGGNLVALSEDHKPNAEQEQKRIEAAGYTVDESSGVPRVDGLAVSRGFGDFKLKEVENLQPEAQPVTALPDIREFDLTDEVEFIVVACDGIWDCLQSEEVVTQMLPKVKEASKVEDLTKATSDLFDSILPSTPQQLGTDNMTMITVRFNKNCKQ